MCRWLLYLSLATLESESLWAEPLFEDPYAEVDSSRACFDMVEGGKFIKRGHATSTNSRPGQRPSLQVAGNSGGADS